MSLHVHVKMYVQYTSMVHSYLFAYLYVYDARTCIGSDSGHITLTHELLKLTYMFMPQLMG